MSVSNVKVTPGNGALTVAWTLGRTDQAAIVKWRARPSGAWSVGLGVVGVQIGGLSDGVVYDVQVVSVTGSGVVWASGTPVGGKPNPIPPYPVIS